MTDEQRRMLNALETSAEGGNNLAQLWLLRVRLARGAQRAEMLDQMLGIMDATKRAVTTFVADYRDRFTLEEQS